ncbi:olfactory receptor 4F4-like [Moschus berezovskii]|uniref:olfactory receptor 4F4-like n=1 Tax=Moschus berezovskii TaxID=68408 RepID=UPI002444A34F|nr:olfactory receptor 4F4-like [Moschus berezovskii]
MLSLVTPPNHAWALLWAQSSLPQRESSISLLEPLETVITKNRHVGSQASQEGHCEAFRNIKGFFSKVHLGTSGLSTSSKRVTSTQSYSSIKLEETELNGRSNQSVVSEFIFLGLCDSWELQAFLLVIFSSLYLITILGNVFIVLLITADLHLHCPMYFLLANLSFIDLCLSSVTTPKMITDFLKANKTISFGSCMCQIFFGHFFGGGEMVLLVSMAYDRYVAICKPLHYASIMNTQMCIWLVMTSWIIGFVHSISQIAIIIQLPFCGPRELDSFFCDIPLVIKLACMNTYVLEMLINADSGVLATICFILLLISYSYILLTLCHQSKDGASKALSTCTAHITVVVLFFGPCIFIYLFPLSITWVDKFLAVFYAAITPLLNPVIYTLRNKEIKIAIKRLC